MGTLVQGQEEGKLFCITAKPFQSCEFKLLYDKGLVPEYGITETYYKDGFVTKPTPGWYSLDGGKTKLRKAELDKKIVEGFKND